MVLSDITIIELCTGNCVAYISEDLGNNVSRVLSTIFPMMPDKPMIEPFFDHSVREVDGEKVVSYGLSSYGYDIRLAPEFKTFTKPNDGRIIDVKDFNEEEICETIHADHIVVPPGGLVLARTLEYFRIPRNVVVTCLGKSTWARVGAIVHPTPLEPEWEGHLVIEITNGTNLPLKIYANEGIAQLIFTKGDRPCKTSYSDRGGKYQGQKGVTTSRM
jgi:dCTP deaminase